MQSKDGKTITVGVGPNTVNVWELKTRIKGLGHEFDWSKLDKIITIRNHMEHRYYDGESSVVSGAFSASLSLIIKILEEHLELMPIRVITSDCLAFLRENDEVFQAKLLSFRNSLSSIEELIGLLIGRLKCSECYSPFLRQRDRDNDEFEGIRLVCDECYVDVDLRKAFESLDDLEMYVSETNGGEPDLLLSECEICHDISFWETAQKCLSRDCLLAQYCNACGEILESADLSYSDEQCSSCRESIHDG